MYERQKYYICGLKSMAEQRLNRSPDSHSGFCYIRWPDMSSQWVPFSSLVGTRNDLTNRPWRVCRLY